MAHKLLRIMLAGLILPGLLIFSPAAPAQAGGAGHWAASAPVIDGIATDSEWSAAIVIIYTQFQVRYQNDAQFAYFLFDVLGEHPAAPNAISADENFILAIDVDQNGAPTANVDVAYALTYAAPNPLGISKCTGPGSWSGMSPAVSYGKAGFGRSPGSATPHRVYEVAIRLSEVKALPGHSLLAGFAARSTNPYFNEAHPDSVYSMAGFTGVGLASPLVAFVYNTQAGYSDGLAFQSVLFDNAGIWTEFVPLGQVELIDFRPYQAILVGDDTGGSGGSTWLGTAAAANKIRTSGKPVVGIGYGGTGLFGNLGLVLNHANSWNWLNTGNINSVSIYHPAWNTPNTVLTGNPVAVYSTAVPYKAIQVDAGSPRMALTTLGKDVNDGPGQYHYALIGQQANGVCYTLWGFRSQPGNLTANGKKLFANVVWNPICMPSVLYLSGSDSTLTSGMTTTLLGDAGFYTLISPASGAASQDFSGFGEIVVGWDTGAAWSTPANVDAIRKSRLPVLGMGEGGGGFFMSLGLSSWMSWTPYNQTAAMLNDPLQRVMRGPYPVLVDATLLASLDSSSGAWEYSHPETSPTKTNIGYITGFPQYHSFFTQSYNGVCYSFYGLQSYAGNMTALAKSLFRNMAAAPRCNFPVNLPIVTK